MKNKYELSPMDSWLSFSPGKGMNLTPQLQEKWIQKARDFRKMRGDILTASFEVENLLDEIMSEVFFPGLSTALEENQNETAVAAYLSNSVLKNVFDTVFLKTSANTFGRKIGLFRNVSKEVRALRDLLSEQLLLDLKRCVEIRNAFGHAPITFEVVGEDENRDFAALILVSGEIVELDNALSDGYKALFVSLTSALRLTSEKLRLNSQREGNSPLSRDGMIWFGHAALTDDSWQVKDPNKPIDLRDFYLRGSRPNLKLDVTFSTDDEEGDAEDQVKREPERDSPPGNNHT